MSSPEPVSAIAAYLLAHVGDLVSARVFRPQLPVAENELMPRACIVVRPAGGYGMFGAGTLAVGDRRMDVICYGSTALEAQNIADAALLALKAMGRQVLEGTLLHWARISSGVVPVVDPETSWPAGVVTVQVMHSEFDHH